jgi:hypothetical protein
MSKKMQIFIVAIVICACLSITSVVNAVTVTITCGSGYSVTADCGDQCLNVDCQARQWVCRCCP